MIITKVKKCKNIYEALNLYEKSINETVDLRID